MGVVMSSEKFSQQVERSSALDDLLEGADEIGAFINKKPTQVYYIHKTKKPPLGKYIGKVGKELIASKAKLTRALKDSTP
jgi:hypothetical protein